jgi:nicotinamide riboside transporter PnuC
VLRLDYLSCVLTIVSTILVGRRRWEGWLLAGINSVIICLIGFRTSEFGFIPANVFCIVLYGINVRKWRADSNPEQGHACAFEKSLGAALTSATPFSKPSQNCLRP